jgi:hypothetical protein
MEWTNENFEEAVEALAAKCANLGDEVNLAHVRQVMADTILLCEGPLTIADFRGR